MKVNVVSGKYLSSPGSRLDASFYDPNVDKVLKIIYKSAKILYIKDLCDVWLPGRFKRCPVDDPEFGIPFLSTSDILEADPSKSFSYYVSNENTPELASLIPVPGSILVSRSGTVGNCVYVSDVVSKYAVSEHAIRVVPKKQILGSFIFTFLSSEIGQALIRRYINGSVVDEIAPEHILQLPIPWVMSEIVEEIDSRVTLAARKRSEALTLLNETETQYLSTLELPPLKTVLDKPNLFYVGSKELDFRLDAGHYNPSGMEATMILRNHPTSRLLKDVTVRIFHPFRMNMVMVDQDHGVPFLGGGDITQTRYFAEKYISPTTDNYQDYLLFSGWTLMSIGGTIGKVSYVGDYLNGCAASQHVTRFVPKITEILPGYLYAFIRSKYAQLQINTMVYGSVVDTIRESQLEKLFIPVPDMELQKPIHAKVEQAFRLRYEANILEDEAREIFNQAIGFD